MKHKDPETTSGAASPRRSHVELWAPFLVLAVVAAVVWASFWSDSAVDDVASDRSDASQATAASDDTDDSGDSDGSGDDGAGERSGSAGAEPEHAEPEQLAESVRRFRAAQRRLAARVSRQVEEVERRTQPFEFQVASYNVLGDSHTGPGGNKNGYPDGGPRMDMSIAALRNNGIDVVGFQEFEQSQYGMFTSRAGEYSLYPGMSLGNKSVRFNIAWRSDVFQLVEAHTLSIPYAGGSRIAMPVVLLESISTGRRAWFANFHNPADTPNLGNNARWRAEAAAIEVAHLTELHQADGTPVIATGDYNERAEIFCRFTAGGVFTAAAGGSSAGGCSPPPSMQVDWVFGSTGVAFTGYSVTGTGQASDHSMVHSTATLTGDDGETEVQPDADSDGGDE
ncbi:endonuclease/exonuclease/phosphatase family protein [Nocardioides cavernae]|uniref:Endonuclease/exonuclease/phosphatase family protein n=1 Tax=Nocardioides cavernae TaxID=1921566 RepID=A0ABR8NDG2_9ACTN|nr:endonuclease/exonuclease/phosphatase family protein [Nocardioides cavernae]MBD3925266.1 endonuclease/exonuclease/phosphatase family protein [Nocardioides cavernae]MBM7514355.1 endonuclease/exonuclease/phosphatase family metal-dependent hydrolase [Nocardioides cavernae]